MAAEYSFKNYVNAINPPEPFIENLCSIIKLFIYLCVAGERKSVETTVLGKIIDFIIKKVYSGSVIFTLQGALVCKKKKKKLKILTGFGNGSVSAYYCNETVYITCDI